MNFYPYDKIKSACSCLDIAKSLLSLDVKSGRCAATWRGGDGQNVAINDDGWFDHKTSEKGSVIDLVAVVKFGGDITLAQDFLGEHLNLQPNNPPRREHAPQPNSRYDELLSMGYAETKRYDYTDAAGVLLFQVVRLEHATHSKEFLQCRPGNKWGRGTVSQVLYNLPAVINAQSVCIAEGEKDADTLNAIGLVATTNAGGGKRWLQAYNDYFAGKEVAILADNDDTGVSHAAIIAHQLVPLCTSVRIVKTSDKPKGDVSDYIAEGHTINDLMSLIRAAPVAGPGVDLAAAKEANKEPLCNYWEERVGNKNAPIKRPRKVNEIVDDIHRRFLRFPKMVGSQMFDQDRRTGRVNYFKRPPELFAWMLVKSCNVIDWQGGSSFPNKDEMFYALSASSEFYEGVSTVPDWPRREDIYYAHRPLPPPTPDHSFFWQWVDFFSPATDADRIMIATLFASPLYYRKGVPRPLFIVDSETAGSGKTTLAEAAADLYGNEPICVSRHDLQRNYGEVVKRVVSAEGRAKRIFLMDNISGPCKSETLSSMITASSITGRRAYGEGEETRPNNLTFVLTANNAQIDDDLAIRAYFVKLKAVKYSSDWACKRRQYMEENREQIIADLIAILEAHQARTFDAQVVTRTPQFEKEILQAMCADVNQYSAVIKSIFAARDSANIDEEIGASAEDAIRFELDAVQCDPRERYWLTSAVVKKWLADVVPDPTADALRNLARQGHAPHVHSATKIFPHRGEGRRRGAMWMGDGDERDKPVVLVVRGKKVVRQGV